MLRSRWNSALPGSSEAGDLICAGDESVLRCSGGGGEEKEEKEEEEEEEEFDDDGPSDSTAAREPAGAWRNEGLAGRDHPRGVSGVWGDHECVDGGGGGGEDLVGVMGRENEA